MFFYEQIDSNVAMKQTFLTLVYKKTQIGHIGFGIA